MSKQNNSSASWGLPLNGTIFPLRKLLFVFFLSLYFLFFAQSNRLSADISFHTVLGASSSFHLSQSNRYPSKVHPVFGFTQGLRFGFGRHLALEPFMGVASLWASDLSGGFSYRGVTAFSAGLLVEVDIVSFLPASTEEDCLFLGFSLGGKANLAQYEFTELYFFYPSLIIEPLLMFTFPKEPYFFLRLSLPGEGHFRRDLLFAGNLGLKLSAAYAPF